MANDTKARLKEAVRQARAPSLVHTGIQRIWEELRESHRLAAERDKELPQFPYWIMREVPHKNLEQIIDRIYGKDDNAYFKQHPVILTVYGKKKEDAWQFYLFFGNLHQKLVKRMKDVAEYLKRHPRGENASFDTMYRKVKKIRDKGSKKRMPGEPINKLGFYPWHFESYRVFATYPHFLCLV